MALVLPRWIGPNVAYVSSDATGFNLPPPFDVAPFGRRTTPNLVNPVGFRDFTVSLQASTPGGGGTHVFLRFHHPRTLAFLFEYELAEFIVQDEHQETSWGMHSNRAGEPQQAMAQCYPFALSFDAAAEISTIELFEGVQCSR